MAPNSTDPEQQIAERFADRFVNEHDVPDNWCPATWAAYRAGIAAVRRAETPVMTLQQAADAGLTNIRIGGAR